MHAIRSILVVIEPDHSSSLALNRAKLLASVTQSHLHLLICSQSLNQQSLLDEYARALTEKGISVSTQQAWHHSPHQTILAVQQTQACNLVVKQHFPDNPFKKALLTPDDWKLLRYSANPVLMVKSDRPWTGRVVLAAVDLGSKNGEHHTLHAGIISNGYDIAELAKGELHVLSAHPSPMFSAADPTYQVSESIRLEYLNKCKKFQEINALPEGHLHIEEGPADVLIPHIAHKLDAAVTIIGTVARTGLSGALIGNTAEVVLDLLESDVLVIKPEDIIEPLETLVARR